MDNNPIEINENQHENLCILENLTAKLIGTLWEYYGGHKGRKIPLLNSRIPD